MAYLPAGVGDLAASLANCDGISSVCGSIWAKIGQISPCCGEGMTRAQGETRKLLGADELTVDADNLTHVGKRSS